MCRNGAPTERRLGGKPIFRKPMRSRPWRTRHLRLLRLAQGWGDGRRFDAFFLRIDDNCLVRNRSQPDGAWVIFAVASSLMVAHQVAGKALRDGLFLSRFT